MSKSVERSGKVRAVEKKWEGQERTVERRCGEESIFE